jgi:hypothetical protein
MTSYEEILNSGDNVPLITAGDENSILLKVIQEQVIKDDNGEEIIGVMPPKKVLGGDIVEAFLRWIMNGMPQTAEDAAALSTMPTALPTP